MRQARYVVLAAAISAVIGTLAASAQTAPPSPAPAPAEAQAQPPAETPTPAPAPPVAAPAAPPAPAPVAPTPIPMFGGPRRLVDVPMLSISKLSTDNPFGVTVEEPA